MKCEACGENEALTSPIAAIVDEVIDSAGRFLCADCITKPTNVLARMIRENNESRPD